MRFGGRELFPGKRLVCPGGERLRLEARAARDRFRARLQRLPKQVLDRSIAIGIGLQSVL
jgi:hypothetical protein